MIKKIMSAAFFLGIASVLSAYNPPAGGENVLRISSPELLFEGNSSAGGAFFEGNPT